jgi:hypothetical protein
MDWWKGSSATLQQPRLCPCSRLRWRSSTDVMRVARILTFKIMNLWAVWRGLSKRVSNVLSRPLHFRQVTAPHYRSYYIISLFEVTYKSTIRISRTFHALFSDDVTESRYLRLMRASVSFCHREAMKPESRPSTKQRLVSAVNLARPLITSSPRHPRPVSARFF